MAHHLTAMASNRLRLLQRIAERTETLKLPPFAFSNCRSWPRTNHSSSYSSASSTPLPSLILPSKEVNSTALFGLGNPIWWKLQRAALPEEVSDAHCVGSSNGWLAFVNRRDCEVYLADPFCCSSSVSSKIVSLPSVTTLTGLVGVFREDYSLQNLLEFGGVTEPPAEKSPERMSSRIIRRLAMASTPLLVDGEDFDRNCVVMVSQCGNRQLAFCRIGDSIWSCLHGAQAMDIVYSKKYKLFYTLNTSNNNDNNNLEIKAWDFKKTTFPTMVDIFSFAYGNIYHQEFSEQKVSTYHLVESPEGDILMLQRYVSSIDEENSIAITDEFPDDALHSYRTLLFDVYKLDFEKQTAEPVESLGDTALFVGFNEAFSLSTRDHPELKPNSVYFADQNGDGVGLYDVKERRVAPLHLTSWFKFNKILPPPIWVSMS